jgi:hypothetical protein
MGETHEFYPHVYYSRLALQSSPTQDKTETDEKETNLVLALGYRVAIYGSDELQPVFGARRPREGTQWALVLWTGDGTIAASYKSLTKIEVCENDKSTLQKEWKTWWNGLKKKKAESMISIEDDESPPTSNTKKRKFHAVTTAPTPKSSDDVREILQRLANVEENQLEIQRELKDLLKEIGEKFFSLMKDLISHLGSR